MFMLRYFYMLMHVRCLFFSMHVHMRMFMCMLMRMYHISVAMFMLMNMFMLMRMLMAVRVLVVVMMVPFLLGHVRPYPVDGTDRPLTEDLKLLHDGFQNGVVRRNDAVFLNEGPLVHVADVVRRPGPLQLSFGTDHQRVLR